VIHKFKQLIKTDLIKTSFFTSIATTVKIATAFVLNKIVALYIGPTGIAIIGQFNNFFSIANTIGSGGISTGVVKYIAENKTDKNVTKQIISTSFIFISLCSVLTGISIYLFSSSFSILIFKTIEYHFIFKTVAFSILFTSLNTLMMSILNGFKEIKKYTIANIGSNSIVLILSILLVIKYKITGVLIAIIAGQSIIFFITLTFVVKTNWFHISYFMGNFNRNILQKLSQYSIMTLTSAIMTPLTLLFTRNYIANHLSLKDAGYWQGIWTISEVYLTFITSSLAVYYLPKLSELKNDYEIKKEIWKTSKIILPIVVVCAMIIYVSKNILIDILFTAEFSPMIALFKYQLLGDVIKVACWLLSFQMMAKAMTKLFIITEIIFNLLFIALAVICVHFWGLEGTAIAFCCNYILYLIFLLFTFRKMIF
jgi:polysaccharide transporter, PST family